MKFLLDENIGSDIEVFLSQAGHDVKRVMRGSKNGAVAQCACREKRILITHDIHFSNILMYPPEKYSGIIRIRIHPPLGDKIISSLQKLLGKIKPEDFDKKLYVLEETGFRVR
jgi:predicted nuclease of predicted toxin-antitoxin system